MELKQKDDLHGKDCVVVFLRGVLRDFMSKKVRRFLKGNGLDNGVHYNPTSA
jgi:hypothetical protein